MDHEELEAALKRVMQDTSLSQGTRQLAAGILRWLTEADTASCEQGTIEKMEAMTLMRPTARDVFH